jgi:replicative DNA helicase
MATDEAEILNLESLRALRPLPSDRAAEEVALSQSARYLREEADVLCDAKAEAFILAVGMTQGSDESAIAVLNALHIDDFSQAAHRIIYSAIAASIAADVSPSLQSVELYLRSSNQLEAVGGYEGLIASIATAAVAFENYSDSPMQSSIERTAAHLAELSGKRKLLGVLETNRVELLQSVERGVSLNQTVQDLVENSLAVLGSRGGGSGSISDIHFAQLDIIERIQSGELRETSVGLTGLPDYNEATCLTFGDMAILNAEAKQGKTSWLVFNAYNYARQGYPTIIWSGEQPTAQIWSRFLACHTGINHQVLSRSKQYLNESDLIKLGESSGILSEMPLFIATSTNEADFNREYAQACNFFARLVDAGAPSSCSSVPQILIVDYLQLLARNESAELEEFCKRLKNEYAKRRNLLVLLLAQSPTLGDRKWRMPEADDISYCKTARQHVDMVMGLYRPDYIPIDNRGDRYQNTDLRECTTFIKITAARHVPFPVLLQFQTDLATCRYGHIEQELKVYPYVGGD